SLVLSTPSLHDALPIYFFVRYFSAFSTSKPTMWSRSANARCAAGNVAQSANSLNTRFWKSIQDDEVTQFRRHAARTSPSAIAARSEEHTSELQSRFDLV